MSIDIEQASLFSTLLIQQSHGVEENELIVRLSGTGETERLIKRALRDGSCNEVLCVVQFRRWPKERIGYVRHCGVLEPGGEQKYLFSYTDDSGAGCQISIFSPGFFPSAIGAIFV